MPYRIYQFGGVTLPTALPEDDLSSGEADSTLVDSIGKAFDFWGAARRLPRRRNITFRGWFPSKEIVYMVDHLGNNMVDHLGNYIIAGTAAQWLRNQVDCLRAMEGIRDSLYRQREDDGAIQWITARLLSIRQTRTVDDAGVVARLDLTWESNMANWRSITQSSATVTGSGWLPLNVSSGSDATIEDAVLTITPAATLFTVTAYCPQAGINWSWVGTVSNPSALVIDCGAQTVRNGGLDAYSGLSLNSTHTAQGWLPFASGVTPLTIYLSDSATATITYYNRFI